MEKDIFTSKKKLLAHLGVRENFLYGDFNSKYYTAQIPKSDGSLRTIRPPKETIKAVQHKILEDILCRHTLNSSVYGLSGTMGILHNAKVHQPNWNSTLVTLDIKSFFPSISVKAVGRVFRTLGFNKECAAILTKICTVDGSIPQGSPTSPLLSALVMEQADKRIFDYCRKNGVTYSRYFDDVTLSGDGLNDTVVTKVEAMLTNQGYVMNEKKEHSFAPTDTKIVMSVVVLESRFDVTGKYKGETEDAWKEYKNKSTTYRWNVFMGKMAFYLYINRQEALQFFKLKTGVNFRSRNILRAKIPA